MAKKKSSSRSGGVNISGKANVGGGVYQSDKIGKISNVTRSGGTDINAQGGAVNITGDVVGRDKVTKTTNTTTGMNADDVAKLFDSIYKQINQKPKEDQAEIRDAVEVIKTAAASEAVDGTKPDESAVKMASNSLAMTAPDILKDVAEVALATMASPATGVLAIIRKVLARAAGKAG
jgi:hypothetical protein